MERRTAAMPAHLADQKSYVALRRRINQPLSPPEVESGRAALLDGSALCRRGCAAAARGRPGLLPPEEASHCQAVQANAAYQEALDQRRWAQPSALSGREGAGQDWPPPRLHAAASIAAYCKNNRARDASAESLNVRAASQHRAPAGAGAQRGQPKRFGAFIQVTVLYRPGSRMRGERHLSNMPGPSWQS